MSQRWGVELALLMLLAAAAILVAVLALPPAATLPHLPVNGQMAQISGGRSGGQLQQVVAAATRAASNPGAAVARMKHAHTVKHAHRITRRSHTESSKSTKRRTGGYADSTTHTDRNTES